MKFRYSALICILLLASCAQGSPELRSHIAQIILVEDQDGGFAERLSLFAFWSDTDGSDDFGSIVLTHEETSLTWELDAESAHSRMRGKDRWTGSNAIAGPGGDPMPDGTYTLSVTDRVGNEAIKRFELQRPAFPSRAPARFAVTGDTWELMRNPDSLDFTRLWLFLLDGSGALLASWRVPESRSASTTGTVESLREIARNTVSVQCFAENTSLTGGVLLLPVNLE